MIINFCGKIGFFLHKHLNVKCKLMFTVTVKQYNTFMHETFFFHTWYCLFMDGQAKTGHIGYLRSLYDFKMAKTGLYIADAEHKDNSK